MSEQDLNNFNFENFILFVNDKSSIQISYDWKLIKEGIKCPVYDENNLSTEVIELFGSQLYIRNYQDGNSFWKKVCHPGLSINSISKNGNIECYQFNYDLKNWINNTKEQKKYKLQWIEPKYDLIYELDNYCRNLIIIPY